MYTVVFFGTSDFAVPSLNALANDPRFKIISVITQPDRPVGRHAVMTPPPIKVAAEKLGISILQPEKLVELQRRGEVSSSSDQGEKTSPLQADIFVVASYGKILPQWLLDIPKHGCVNVHGSLLPRWRGASPIQAAIAAGDTETGVTIMKMDAGLDHGPIISTASEPIRPDDIGGSLHDRLAELGAKMLPDALMEYLDGVIVPTEQDHEKTTTCKMLTRDDGKIDWSKPAAEIERLVRAYNPWPGTWTELDGKRVKILIAKLSSSPRGGAGGGVPMTCGDGAFLELTSVQPEGGKPMSGQDYQNGKR